MPKTPKNSIDEGYGTEERRRHPSGRRNQRNPDETPIRRPGKEGEKPKRQLLFDSKNPRAQGDRSGQKERKSFDSEDPYEGKMLELDSPIVPRFYKSNRTERELTIERCGKQIKPIRPGMDSLNTEYLYYTVLLKNSVPLMSRRQDRKKMSSWVEKLSSPAYQTARLRLKRNKYMLKLCLNAINDEMRCVFTTPPPEGVLPAVEDFTEELPPARWEMDAFWFELVKDLPVEKDKMACSAHAQCGENQDEQGSQPVAGALLDHEFRFFLYMARPYTVLLESPAEKSRLAIWLQTLAKIRSCSCLAMKGIRNDYIQALLGYLQELRLTGPFQEFPPLLQPLPPLAQLAKLAAKGTLTDPTHPMTEEFMSSQPKPENGAFCYIAITGEPAAPTDPVAL